MSMIVNNALSYLKQLEEAMKAESDGFDPRDIQHCDNLAQILQDLEFSIKKMHEELETETIKASVFRHKMTFFESDLQREIGENVKAARDSNMEAILDLKNKLEELTKKIEVLHKKDKQLSEEIAQMEPEKRSLETKHENIITLLNDQMAHKALSQIRLNETRDLLRELNQTIFDLEEDMLSLNEKLIKERAEARDIKIGLDDEKRETNAKAMEQEEFNQTKLREVQAAKKAVQESNKSVRILFRENERYEQLNRELKSEIKNGTKQVERNQREHEESVTESLRLTALEAKTQQDYNQNKTDTIRKTKETAEQTTEEIENVKNLKEEQESKKVELKQIYDRFKELQKINDAIKKSIDGIKAEIGEKYKEIAELEEKNQALYVQLGENQQAHSQVMDSLQREAEQCKDQLKHERETRLIKQAEREAKLGEIEAFNANLIIFQSSVDTFMNSNKSRTTELQQKEKSLNEIINHNDKEKNRLTTEVDEAITIYGRMKSDLEANLSNLEKEYSFYTTENDKNLIELNELEPKYKNLCKLYRDKCKDYEETRKSVINAKTRKNNFENKIIQVKQQIKEHNDSRDELEFVLETKRAESLEKMKKQKAESVELEDKILKTGLKMQTIKDQNNKFAEVIQAFEPEFKYMDKFAVDHLTTQDELEIEYQKLHQQLLSGWKSDEELKDFFKEQDNDLVNRLATLLDTTKNRENQVGSVINKMYSELGNMENYLLKMINKDPKEFHFIENK